MSCKLVALTSKLTLTTSYTLPFSTSPFTVIFDELTDPFLFSFFFIENDRRPACCLLEVFPLQAARTDRRYANPYFEFGNPLLL
jgi:hypothetical protein